MDSHEILDGDPLNPHENQGFICHSIRWTPIIHKGLPIIFPVGIRTDPHEICVI